MATTESEQLLAGRGVIYLAACALHNKCPKKEAIAEMQLENVLIQSMRHSMSAITYMAISSYVKSNGDDGIDSDLLFKWKQQYDVAFRRLVFMALEREKLIEFLEKNNIWYMPLKGINFLDYYPKLGMRQMCDNDILIDPERRAEVKDFMLENGYEILYYNKECPDTYQKEGQFSFEIHHGLYKDIEVKNQIYYYYEDISDRLIKNNEQSCRYRFSDEDFYIYIVSHAYKHFSTGGNGTRSLMDMAILSNRFDDKLNREYVDAEIDKLDMTYYEKTVKSISSKLFIEDSPHPSEYESILTEEEMDVLNYHIIAGVFGNIAVHARNRMLKFGKAEKITGFTKFKYVLRRIFPDMHHYKLTSPVAYRYKILIPFAWLLRMFKTVFNFKNIFYEIKIVAKTKKTKDK